MKACPQIGRRGTVALEFAIIAPVLMTLVYGAIALDVAFWTRNALVKTASTTARCVALHSKLCATVPSGCSAASAPICYAQTLAAGLGAGGIASSNVVINGSASYGGASITTVTISHPFTMLGYTITLSASGAYPNS